MCCTFVRRKVVLPRTGQLPISFIKSQLLMPWPRCANYSCIDTLHLLVQFVQFAFILLVCVNGTALLPPSGPCLLRLGAGEALRRFQLVVDIEFNGVKLLLSQQDCWISVHLKWPCTELLLLCYCMRIPLQDHFPNAMRDALARCTFMDVK